MSSPRITCTAHADATTVDEVNALVAVYRLCLDKAKNGGCLLNKSGPDVAAVRNKEGVSHVDRQPD